jgi:L,D-peptidoglycan transpeptidase YkuD (ErfK/YbiS/YcfS/YnhG family)
LDLIISPVAGGHRATYGDKTWRCAVGRAGIAVKQREGDGVSPIGCWPVRRIFYRADRQDKAPSLVFGCTPIDRQDGWCDAPDHPDYNRLVRLPFAASHEEMWRDDHLYDIVVVLGHNDDPVVPGAGSAVFLHVASQDYSPTAGCAALSKDDLLQFLGLVGPEARLCFLRQ